MDIWRGIPSTITHRKKGDFPLNMVYTQSKTTYCNLGNYCSQNFSKIIFHMLNFCIVQVCKKFFTYKYLATHAQVLSNDNVYVTLVSFHILNAHLRRSN